MRLLTNCAACAAPLAQDAPVCVRCRMRYCDASCQHDHWRRGHKQICKKIHRGGGAEQYHADKKYKEAVAVAVEACADDTRGHTCYICTQALHWKTKEGLVRMCACRGTAGFAHVSCLAEQAKILVAEAWEGTLHPKVFQERWERWGRWERCSLCEQYYHGVVKCALGWACWKTYVGRARSAGDSHRLHIVAMYQLGCGLFEEKQYEDAYAVFESLVRNGRPLLMDEGPAFQVVAVKITIHFARVCSVLGRESDCIFPGRPAMSGLEMMEASCEHVRALHGSTHEITLLCSLELGTCLLDQYFVHRAQKLLPALRADAVRNYRPHDSFVLRIQLEEARATYLYHFFGHSHGIGSRGYLRLAVGRLVDLRRRIRRFMGPAHPMTREITNLLRTALNEQLDWRLDDFDLRMLGPEFLEFGLER